MFFLQATAQIEAIPGKSNSFNLLEQFHCSATSRPFWAYPFLKVSF